MKDFEEYEIRKHTLENNPFLKNFKEGYWKSPLGTTIIYAIASYEAQSINISTLGTSYHTSIYPVVWDMTFKEWEYLGTNP